MKTQQPASRLKKTMSIHFVSLIFIWLLPLTASSAVTSGHNKNLTDAMTETQETPNKFTHDQLTTQEAFSSNPLSEVSGPNMTPSIKVDANPAEEKATNSTTKPSLQSTLTMPSKTTAATPTNSTDSQFNSPTVITSAITIATSHASIPTTATRVPSVLSSSTQSPFSSDKMTQLSTRPTLSTELISTTTSSTKPGEYKSTTTSHVTHGAMQPTGLYKTSVATKKTPFIHINKAKERQDPLQKKATPNKGTDHSKAVAGLIGGALVLMMVGFLLIYIKQWNLRRQQITTSDWAGPSPFLEGGADNGQVTLRSSNRISLSSFLPQSLTKRLSMLPDTDEELEDMTQGTTFGREVDGNYVQESNGTAVVVPEMKSTGDAPERLKTLSQ